MPDFLRARAASRLRRPANGSRRRLRGRRRWCCRRRRPPHGCARRGALARSTDSITKHGRALGAHEAVSRGIERPRGRLPAPAGLVERQGPSSSWTLAGMSGWMHASPPPASTTSASPRRISSAASNDRMGPRGARRDRARGWCPRSVERRGDRAARDVEQARAARNCGATRSQPRSRRMLAAARSSCGSRRWPCRRARRRASGRRRRARRRRQRLCAAAQREQHVAVHAPRLLGPGDGDRGRSP